MGVKKYIIGLSVGVLLLAFNNCSGSEVEFEETLSSAEAVEILNILVDSGEDLSVYRPIQDAIDDNSLKDLYGCGNNNAKWSICHSNDTDGICIADNALNTHLNDPGDYLGPCR